MNGYIQLFDDSGNHAAPYPDEYEQFHSLEHAKTIFRDWIGEVETYADAQYASALLFFGEPTGEYPCDTYPDRRLTVGPRGGIISEQV